MVTNRFGLIIEPVGSVSRHIDAAPDTVLDTTTCVCRFPEWNAAIESALEDPGPLCSQSQWVVLMQSRQLPELARPLERTVDHQPAEHAIPVDITA